MGTADSKRRVWSSIGNLIGDMGVCLRYTLESRLIAYYKNSKHKVMGYLKENTNLKEKMKKTLHKK